MISGKIPQRNQIQKLGRFCLYFELGCKLGPSEAQAQNASKNDDLKNGTIFLFDFFVESTCIAPNKAGMCLVLVFNFSEQPVEVSVQ